MGLSRQVREKNDEVVIHRVEKVQALSTRLNTKTRPEVLPQTSYANTMNLTGQRTIAK